MPNQRLDHGSAVIVSSETTPQSHLDEPLVDHEIAASFRC